MLIASGAACIDHDRTGVQSSGDSRLRNDAASPVNRARVADDGAVASAVSSNLRPRFAGQESRDGIREYVDSLGRLREQRMYANGQPHGVWTSWHENGRVSARRVFRRGLAEGVWMRWDNSGQLVEKIAYHAGAPLERNVE